MSRLKEKNEKKISGKKVAYAVILVAIAVALSPFTSFQIGIAKVNPTQHFVNLLGAVILGPWWALLIAGIISLIRNLLGVGTILAFPGSMIGAFLAGYTYKLFKNEYAAGIGEVIGTGIISSFFCVYIVAPFLMKKNMGLLIILASFLISSIIGNIIGVLSLNILKKSGTIRL
jgi:energy-coupling factor transport system ATP-binding protein